VAIDVILLVSSGSGEEPMMGSYEHDNEPLGSIKDGEFLK
jgi:hypothetical protein